MKLPIYYRWYVLTSLTSRYQTPHILSLKCFDITDVTFPPPPPLPYTIVDMYWHHWRHVIKPPIYYRWYVLTSLTSRYQTPHLLSLKCFDITDVTLPNPLHILSLICFDITDVTLSNPPYTIVDMFWHHWRYATKSPPFTIVDIFWHHWRYVIKSAIYYRWYVLTSLTSRFQTPIYYRWYLLTLLTSRYKTPHILSLICFDITDVTLSNPHILSLICFDITDVPVPIPIYYRWYALTSLTSRYQTPIYHRWYALTSLTSRYQTPYILSLICFDITDVTLPNSPYTIVDMFWYHWRHVTKPPIYYRWYVLTSLTSRCQTPLPHILSLICFDITDVTLLNPPYTIVDMSWHHSRLVSKPPKYYRWYILTSLTLSYQTPYIISLICFDVTDVTFSNPHILSLICFDITDVTLSNPLYTIIDMLWHHWRHVTNLPIYYRSYVLTSLTSRYQTPIYYRWYDLTLLTSRYQTPIYYRWYALTSLTSRYQTPHILLLICFDITDVTLSNPHILSLICFDITDVTLSNPPYTIVDMLWHHWRHVIKPPIYYRWYALTSLTSRYQPPHILSLICFDITDVKLPNTHILSLICFDITDVTL